ncbi:MAG: glycosyltransferase family 2 protein [Chromatiales bacterium]|nr:glycosyltransferase family 2 protein [Chromatiales bacterium]
MSEAHSADFQESEDTTDFQIVIPARNEEANIESLLTEIQHIYPDANILVVDDASTDSTRQICLALGAKVISHSYQKGNGAAIKTGIRASNARTLVFMDGDGQHNPSLIPELLNATRKGSHMAIGARTPSSHASVMRRFANKTYNALASLATGIPIPDLTSGYRAVRTDAARQFIHLLPNGFSYPTTITMAFIRSGYTVSFHPTISRSRKGKSHIHPLKDGFRFVLIIFKIGTLYSPLKLFVPLSITFFSLGLIHYAHTFITKGQFTNMSALLFTTSILIFLIGLVSEQITSLIFSSSEKNQLEQNQESEPNE